MVDARDLKSLDAWHRAGSNPASGTSKIICKFVVVYDETIKAGLIQEMPDKVSADKPGALGHENTGRV